MLTILFAALCCLPVGRAVAQGALPIPAVAPSPSAHPTPVAKPSIKIGKAKVYGKTKDRDEADHDQDVPSEQTAATTPTVSVSFCGGSSKLMVRGWDRNEVHARIESGEKIVLKTYNDGGKDAPASRIEVVTGTHSRQIDMMGTCRSTGDVQLDVPRGAVVEIRTNNGDVEVENIARVRVESLSGSLSLRGINKAVDATSFSGDIVIEKVRGSLNLRTISGNIQVRDGGPLDAGDGLLASAVSGEISMSNCTYGQVRVNSVTGELTWNGTLVTGGRYDFSTTSADITFVMPATVSFRVTARVADEGEVTIDFPLKGETSDTSKQLAKQVVAVYGSGGAQLELTTFNGTIRLHKK